MSADERITQLESAFTMLLNMTRNLDERADTHTDWINQLGAAQAETERKIAALVDAQIRTEDALARLTTKMSDLADAQAHTDATFNALALKVDALTDLVKGRG